MVNTTMKAEDFGVQFDADNYFDFTESEDATIMAWGHRDPEAFLDDVLRYDRLCDSTAERGEPGDIRHHWAVRVVDHEAREDDDGWWIQWGDASGLFTADTPASFPVTVWSR